MVSTQTNNNGAVGVFGSAGEAGTVLMKLPVPQRKQCCLAVGPEKARQGSI